jgi:hypothetical protein
LRQLISTIEQVTDSRQFYVEDVADILEIRGEKHLATKLWNIAWRIVEENR